MKWNIAGTGVAIWLALAVLKALAGDPPARFTSGSATDLQALLDQAPVGAAIVCEQSRPLVIAATLLVRKSLTLRGLKACLPPELDKTPILVVDASNVTLTDLELRGNYDTVGQQHRAPLIHVKRGGFRIERCKFFDSSKDGIMVTPDDNGGDIVGGVIREIEGSRIARDLVSLSGGNGGLRIRDVTVENVRLKTGFLRGAVEVSDGADNITVRHVYAEDAVYGIDVQDHGAKDQQGRACSPNTRVVLEDVTAVRCKHILRTANHPLGHTDLTLRQFVGRDCAEPLRIANTARVRIEGLTIQGEKPLNQSPVELRNDQDVVLRNVEILVPAGTAPVTVVACAGVVLDGVKCNGAMVERPAEGKPKKRDAKSGKVSKQPQPSP